MKKLFQILSTIIGILLCVVVVMKTTNNLAPVKYDTLDFIILLVGISFVFGLPKLLFEATSLKFMDFEWKRVIAEVKMNLRQ